MSIPDLTARSRATQLQTKPTYSAGKDRQPASALLPFIAGLTWALPFLGRFGPIPTSTIAVVLPAVSAGILLVRRPPAMRISAELAVFLVLAALYSLAIIQSAAASQFAFLATPELWLQRSSYYYDAKLLTFLLAAGPPVAAVVLAASVSDRVCLVNGLFWAVLIVALLAGLRLLQYADLLTRTSAEEARPIMAEPYRFGFSTVSFGILFLTGSIAALSLKRTWILTAAFLFLAFWINRKTDVLLIVASVGLFSAFHLWKGGIKSSRAWRALPIFGISLAAGLMLHNQANIHSWRFLGEAIGERLSILDKSVGHAKNFGIIDGADEGIPDDLSVGVAEQQARRSGIAAMLFGYGMGWHATFDKKYKYPHNLLIENVTESGIISAALLLAIMGLALSTVVRTEMDIVALSASLMLWSLFIISMKAGDVRMAGTIMTFCALFFAAQSGRRRRGGLAVSNADS